MNPEKFTIDARSCTLLPGEKPGLLVGIPYVIPVYQRPYAWGPEQVRRVLRGIVGAYQNEQEPYFLGTMQLMPKHDGQGRLYWEIVDGQQRLTTLLLLFRVLRLHYGPDLLPDALRATDWLSTRVSNGEQQQWLTEALTAESLPATPEAAGQNRYLANAVRLAEQLRQLTTPEEGAQPLVVDAQFVEYVVRQLYVVVIETQAGLAKTLDIFNTINTAGMDLNGGDVFKIQLFEYLTRQLGQPDSVFSEIDALYASIDAGNKRVEYHATDIQEILEIYKYIVVERAGSSRALHDLGTTTFYERLFACLLLNENLRNFDREKMRQALGSNPLADLNRLVEVRFVWETEFSSQHNLWYHLLIGHTRYGWRYWTLDIIYLFRFYRRENWDAQQFEEWNQLLVRYYMVKTIQFRRAVLEAHRFTHNVIRVILSPSSTPIGLIGQLRKKLAAHNQSWYRDGLLGDVFENAKQRYLIFRLLAMIEEADWNSKELFKKFFDKRYDVEHIRPRQPRMPNAADDQLWASHLNRLGNLVLLEEDINRSERIGNHHFAHKWVGYEDSQLEKIAQLRDDHRDLEWTVAKCEARTQVEADKLMAFLFAGCVPDSN